MPFEVTATYESDPAGSQRVPDYTFGAYAIDVAVDSETGKLVVADALLVADVGTILNPIAHRGQIDGGFVCGLGVALMEERPLDESGKPVSLSLGDYKIPTIRDVPPLRTVYVTARPGSGPFGAKMVGELSNAGVAPRDRQRRLQRRARSSQLAPAAGGTRLPRVTEGARMIVRALAALAALLVFIAGASPANAYTPHVLRFNYDEDDLTTLNPFLAAGAPGSPRSTS